MWQVSFHWDFKAEFFDLPLAVREELLAQAGLLAKIGPQLGRPRVDTLKGSAFPKMKELRFDANGGVWRVAFAFDPRRNAILLVCGDKSGGGEKRFYRALIAKADARFAEHLAALKREELKGTLKENR